MGQHDLIVLTFTDPLRGRQLRSGYLPSDLLWGALYSADVRLQGGPMPLDNPYRVSSAFPFAGGEWLLPKPRTTAQSVGTLDSSDKKAVKKLEFVNLPDFLSLARGERLNAERLQAAQARQKRALLPVSTEMPLKVGAEDFKRSLRGTRHAAKGAELARERYAASEAQLSDAERLHLSREARGRSVTGQAERQRNTQDRLTQATSTFMTDQLTQPQLAFLLESTSETQRARLMAALRLLSDTGLGGMRTQGSGQFEFTVTRPKPELLERLNQAGPQILLNLTRPGPEEAQQISDDAESRYSLIRRDGFLDGSELQRQDVWMLAEGSLVPTVLSGTLPDVAPPDYPHPVWRSGLAVSLGIT